MDGDNNIISSLDAMTTIESINLGSIENNITNTPGLVNINQTRGNSSQNELAKYIELEHGYASQLASQPVPNMNRSTKSVNVDGEIDSNVEGDNITNNGETEQISVSVEGRKISTKVNYLLYMFIYDSGFDVSLFLCNCNYVIKIYLSYFIELEHIGFENDA